MIFTILSEPTADCSSAVYSIMHPCRLSRREPAALNIGYDLLLKGHTVAINYLLFHDFSPVININLLSTYHRTRQQFCFFNFYLYASLSLPAQRSNLPFLTLPTLLSFPRGRESR